MMWSLSDQLPTNLFRYVFAISWRHQIALVGLTVIALCLKSFRWKSSAALSTTSSKIGHFSS